MMNMLDDVPVVIFCGGRGARFNAQSDEMPKPLIQVCGKPILRHLIDSFYDQGFRRFILPYGHLGNRIWGFAHDMNKEITDIEIEAVDTGATAHVGQRLSAVRHLLSDGAFVMTYGDGLSDVLMRDVIASHQDGKAITVTAVRPPGRFGVIGIDTVSWPGNIVSSFNEKPVDDLINGGFMIAERRFIDDYIVDDYDFECTSTLEFAMSDAARSRDMCAHIHHGYWQCMDTRRDLEMIEATAEMLGRLPWRHTQDA